MYEKKAEEQTFLGYLPLNKYNSIRKQQNGNKYCPAPVSPYIIYDYYLLHALHGVHGLSCLKKSLPLSSTNIKAGKFSTLIFHIASMPSSGYSTHSMLLMQLCDSTAATPPIVPN